MPVDLEKYRKQPTQGANPVNLSKYRKTTTPQPAARGFLGTKKDDTLTGKILDNSVTRGIQAFFPGKKVGEAIGTLGGLGVTAAKEKLGIAPKGTTAAYDTTAPSPLQVAGDVAKGAAAVAGLKVPVPTAATALGTVGKAALSAGALGAVGGAGQAATETSGAPIPTKEDAIDVAKGAAVGFGVGAATGGAVSAAGQILRRAGDKIIFSKIKPSQADIEDGFSVETVKKYGLEGSLDSTLKKTEAKMDELTGQLNEKLAASDARIDLRQVYANTVKKLDSNKYANFGSAKNTGGALQQISDEIDEVAGDGISVMDAQTVKRAAGHYGAWTFGQTDPDSTARQKVYSAFYRELKEEIERASPEGVREINKQLSELIPVLNAVIRRIPIAERNNLLSLTDIIALSSTAVDPSGAGVAALNLASKSGRVGGFLARTGERITNTAKPLGSLFGTGGASLLKSDDR